MLLGNAGSLPRGDMDPDRWCLLRAHGELVAFSEWGELAGPDWCWRRSTAFDKVQERGDGVFFAETASGSTYTLRLSRYKSTVSARDYVETARIIKARGDWELVESAEEAAKLLIEKATVSS